jgi:hypothetical protein
LNIQSTFEGTEFLDHYFERTAKSRVKMRITSSLWPKIETVKSRFILYLGALYRSSTVLEMLYGKISKKFDAQFSCKKKLNVKNEKN